MAKRVLRTAWEHIRSDCGELRELAFRALDAAGSGDHDLARQYTESIDAVATRHFRLVDSFLPVEAQRALRSDHNRLLQLVRSIVLAMRDAQWAQVIDYLERLLRLLAEHERNEHPHLPSSRVDAKAS